MSHENSKKPVPSFDSKEQSSSTDDVYELRYTVDQQQRWAFDLCHSDERTHGKWPVEKYFSNLQKWNEKKGTFHSTFLSLNWHGWCSCIWAECQDWRCFVMGCQVRKWDTKWVSDQFWNVSFISVSETIFHEKCITVAIHRSLFLSPNVKYVSIFRFSEIEYLKGQLELVSLRNKTQNRESRQADMYIREVEDKNRDQDKLIRLLRKENKEQKTEVNCNMYYYFYATTLKMSRIKAAGREVFKIISYATMCLHVQTTYLKWGGGYSSLSNQFPIRRYGWVGNVTSARGKGTKILLSIMWIPFLRF